MKVYYDSNEDGTANQLISNVIDYPSIMSRMDRIGTCQFTVIDRLGALYSTWEPLDSIKVRVDDDNSHVLFKGYVTDKYFKHNELRVSCRGIGIKTEWNEFHNDYILAEGVVEAVTYAGASSFEETLDVNDEEGTNDWHAVGGDHSDAVSDSSDTTYVYADPTDDAEVEQFKFEDVASYITVTECTQVKIRLRGKIIGAPDQVAVDISFDNGDNFTVAGPQNTTFGAATSWVELTWNGGLSEASLTGLEVKMTAGAVGVMESVLVYEIEAVCTFTGTNDRYLGVEKDNDEGNFEWAVDKWIEPPKDNGLLVFDHTGGDTHVEYTCSAVAFANEDSNNGNAASINTIDDDDHAYSRESIADPNGEDLTLNATMTPTISGANIDTADYLQRFNIEYQIGITLTCAQWGEFGNTATNAKGILQLYDGSDYHDIKTIWLNTLALSGGANKEHWSEGTIENEGTIVIEGTNAYLATFLHDDGADHYDYFKGVRFVLSGSCDADSLEDDVHVDLCIDFLKITIDYHTDDISPIMVTISDSGAEWLTDGSTDWTTAGVQVDDKFFVGENTTKILVDVMAYCGLGLDLRSTTQYYIARNLRGSHCIDVINNVCKLEGFHWWEDYTNDCIVICAETDMHDSGIDLTNANYMYDWEIHDSCNEVKTLWVYGNAASRARGFYTDHDSTSPIIKTHVDDTIMTSAECNIMAENMMAEISTKRPAITIPLQGVNHLLIIGDTVDLTMVNPTRAEAAYPISKIIRNKGGYVATDDIWTTITCGLGHSTPEERIMDAINYNNYQARKAQGDKLSTTPYSSTSGSITWDDIGGKPDMLDTSDVEDIITAEIVDGQSIDNAIDTLIAAEATTQHDRMIYPSILYPRNGETVGAANVYYSSSVITHGTTSKTNNNYVRTFWELPADYVDGEDITLRVWWRSPNTDNPNVIDYKVIFYKGRDGQVITTEQTTDATWSGPDNGKRNSEDVVLTGTNLLNGDFISIVFYMEDDNNSVVTYLENMHLIVPVNTRD